MKREIKFRGKRTDNGEWVYGYYWSVKDIHFIQDTHGNQLMPFDHKVDLATVGQYTGLKDKNGTEIYEGDSLFVNRIGDYPLNQNHHVVYNRYFATFATDQDSTFDWVRYEGKYTVTGNIHDK